MARHAQSAPIGILSVATVVGEHAADVAELAAKHDASEELVRRSLGDSTVWTTSRSRAEIAAELAATCLAAAGLASADLIVWCEAPDLDNLRVAEQLGLAPKTIRSVVSGCHRVLLGLEAARRAIALGEADRVLVLCVELWRFADGRRALGPMVAGHLQDFFSDGGSAVLVGRGERNTLRGHAAATDDTTRDFFPIYLASASLTAAEIVAHEMQAMVNTVRLGTEALTLALAQAGLTREALDHVVLQQEPTAVRRFHLRRLGLSPDTLVEDVAAVAHLGSSDVLLTFDRARTRGAFHVGERVALIARTPGSVAVTIIEV